MKNFTLPLLMIALLGMVIAPLARAATRAVTINTTDPLVNTFLPVANGASQLSNSPAWKANSTTLGVPTYTESLETLTPGANVSLNWLTARTKRITLGQNTTFTFANTPTVATNIQRMLVGVIGDGAFTVTFTGIASTNWQTAQLSVPPTAVITYYIFEAASSIINGYVDTGSTTIGDIPGLQAALDGKQTVGNYIEELTDQVVASGPGSVPATVRGIRETSGPTLLTIGAIADGEVAKRVGTTLIGSPDVNPLPNTDFAAIVASDPMPNAWKGFTNHTTILASTPAQVSVLLAELSDSDYTDISFIDGTTVSSGSGGTNSGVFLFQFNCGAGTILNGVGTAGGHVVIIHAPSEGTSVYAWNAVTVAWEWQINLVSGGTSTNDIPIGVNRTHVAANGDVWVMLLSESAMGVAATNPQTIDYVELSFNGTVFSSVNLPGSVAIWEKTGAQNVTHRLGSSAVLPQDATQYLDGTGNFSVPAGDGAVPVGTMINTGTPAVGAIPRHTDTSGTNTEPSIVIVDGSGNVTGVNSIDIANSVTFEGSVVDSFEGSLIATNITGVDKQWILPNKTGTFIMSGDQLTGDLTTVFGLEDDGTTPVTIAANAVALTTDTTGNYVSGLTGTANEITVTHTPGEGSTGTFSLPTGISAAKIAGGNVSSAEFDFLDGVTSAIQTQIDTKQASFTTGAGVTNIANVISGNYTAGANITLTTNANGAVSIAGSSGGIAGTMINTGANVVGNIPRASDTSPTNYVPSLVIVDGSGNVTAPGTVTATGGFISLAAGGSAFDSSQTTNKMTNFVLTASRAVVTGTDQAFESSATTATELGFVSGVTSAIQTQINTKAPLASPTFTGTATFPTPFTLGAVSVLPTGTELNFVDGVTSAIQTQLDSKAALGANSDITSMSALTGDLAGPTQITFSGGQALVGSTANRTSIRNSTTAQIFELSNTHTDDSNYERMKIGWASNIIRLGTEKAGTGTARALSIDFGGTTTSAISIPITSGVITLGGSLAILAGTSSTTVKAGGSLKVDTTTTGNVGAGEDTLITYTIPAAVFASNTDSIEFDTWGTCAANTNPKQIKVYYGATVLIDGGAVVLNGISWRAHGKIVRTGAATQTATSEMTVGGTLLSAINGTIALTTTPAETSSGTVVFKVTGASTVAPADNDIVQNGMVLKYQKGQ